MPGAYRAHTIAPLHDLNSLSWACPEPLIRMQTASLRFLCDRSFGDQGVQRTELGPEQESGSCDDFQAYEGWPKPSRPSPLTACTGDPNSMKSRPPKNDRTRTRSATEAYENRRQCSSAEFVLAHNFCHALLPACAACEVVDD